MNQEKYEFVKGPGVLYYEFTSEGPYGNIKKIVRYSPIQAYPNKIYNLAFGDWDETLADINDTVKTNNHDRQKVLATVAQTAADFLHYQPDALIFVQGSTLSRTRLYQMGISSIWKEIEQDYSIFGYVNEQWQPFARVVNYEAFLVKRK